jgi:hypothetical protein
MDPLNLIVFENRPRLTQLGGLTVSYQAAQFLHLQEHATIVWQDDTELRDSSSVTQLEDTTGLTFAELAVRKRSVTAANRSSGRGAELLLQYVDNSSARAQVNHDVFGLKTPEIGGIHLDTGGITRHVRYGDR